MPRRAPIVVQLAVAAAALAAAPAARGAGHPDAADPGTPIDLRNAALVQRGDELRWEVELAAPLDLAALAGGGPGTLCLVLRYGTLTRPRARVCIVPGEGARDVRLRYTRLEPGAPPRVRTLKARIRRPDETRVVSSFAIADVGLRERRFNWQVTSAVPGAPVDVLPDSGVVFADTTTPTPAPAPTPSPAPAAGCVAGGPEEVRRAPGRPNAVALTFDDGPGADTPRVLHILEHEHVPATFFVIGSQVPGHSALLKRMLRDGDALGNHSYTHANLAGGGAGEIARTQQAIRRATGYTPCLMRPPYGATSATLVGEIRAARMTSVLWDVDPRDWARPGAGAIYDRIMGQTSRGSIVLMHDGGGPRGQTVAALGRVIASFRHRGYRFATVPDLLGYKPRGA